MNQCWMAVCLILYIKVAIMEDKNLKKYILKKLFVVLLSCQAPSGFHLHLCCDVHTHQSY